VEFAQPQQEGAMHYYEIRLVRQGGPMVLSSRYASDYAAVRSARAMATSDDVVEIWRGMECIYRDQPASSSWRYAS
jgi:hypothetical protein